MWTFLACQRAIPAGTLAVHMETPSGGTDLPPLDQQAFVGRNISQALVEIGPGADLEELEAFDLQQMLLQLCLVTAGVNVAYATVPALDLQVAGKHKLLEYPR